MTWFLLVAALLAGQATAAEPLRVEQRQVDRKLPGCGDAKDGCVHVSFDYVEALSGPPAVRAKINSAVMGVLLERGQHRARSLQDYAPEFIKDYQESPKLFADERWFISKTVKVLRATPPVFSLAYWEEYYTGPPHPYSATQYLNFDAETGERVTLAAVLNEGWMPRLTHIAEAHFREVRKLAPSADLKEADLDFPDNRFRLNDTYGFTEKSLLFFYNDYEVGPRSNGATKVEIPYTEIRDLLRPGFVK
jgi:Protein of unknown function (DUF3298)